MSLRPTHYGFTSTQCLSRTAGQRAFLQRRDFVELKGKPQVGARQPKPAAAKKIRGRTLDVEVQTGGQIKTTPVKRKGRHTITPQEVEVFLPWSKAKKKPKTPRPVFPKVGKGRNSARRRPATTRLQSATPARTVAAERRERTQQRRAPYRRLRERKQPTAMQI